MVGESKSHVDVTLPLEVLPTSIDLAGSGAYDSYDCRRWTRLVRPALSCNRRLRIALMWLALTPSRHCVVGSDPGRTQWQWAWAAGDWSPGGLV